jgi:NADH-quinone oxidoreductase subunit L
LVGFSSYMLIGHYLKTAEAAAASRKAFIVNRVGDFGLLLGIILVYWTYGTVSLPGLQAILAGDPGQTATLVGLLLFCGVLGKSAQMPLHVWLPDAMAGPTPVSALIHAATMVAAGVFMLGRTWFLYSAGALEVITWVGVVTALSAAIWAFAQNDIKRILAYSTLSQLGFMVAAFGLGSSYGLLNGAASMQYGVWAAMFHLTTHAFFKALLFLGSGSVIHACHHERDIFKMGGLYRRMPITTATFVIGVVAIAGVPFVGAGFFSKDGILLLARAIDPLMFGILVFTALLTATYMGRLLVIAFFGQANSEHASHAHESPVSMWLPLVVLAALSVVGGHLALYPATWRPGVLVAEGAEHLLLIGISAGAALIGLATAWFFYRPGAATDRLQAVARPVWLVCRSRFYFDEIYDWYVAKVQQRLADVLAFIDTLFIGGLAVRGTAGVAGLLGIIGRSLHTGNVNTYAWWTFAGVALVWAWIAGVFTSLF